MTRSDSSISDRRILVSLSNYHARRNEILGPDLVTLFVFLRNTEEKGFAESIFPYRSWPFRIGNKPAQRFLQAIDVIGIQWLIRMIGIQTSAQTAKCVPLQFLIWVFKQSTLGP